MSAEAEFDVSATSDSSSSSWALARGIAGLALIVTAGGTFAAFEVIVWINELTRGSDATKHLPFFRDIAYMLIVGWVVLTMGIWSVRVSRLRALRIVTLATLVLSISSIVLAFHGSLLGFIAVVCGPQYVFPVCPAFAGAAVVRAVADAAMKKERPADVSMAAGFGCIICLVGIYLSIFVMKYQDLGWAVAMD